MAKELASNLPGSYPSRCLSGSGVSLGRHDFTRKEKMAAIPRDRHKRGRVLFTIKPASKPGAGGQGKRATWSLTRREMDGTFVKLEMPEIDAINKGYANEVFDWDSCFDMFRALRDRLYRQRDKESGLKVFNQENHALLAEYWEKVYSKRKPVDKDTMLWDFKRAVDAIGQVSLMAATQQEIQQNLDRSFKLKPNLQRRAVDRLNTLLKYFGRSDSLLVKEREEHSEINYLTPDEFERVAMNISNDMKPFRIMCGVAMYTGLRLGEISALNKDNIGPRAIKVFHQIDDEGIRRTTKNRKSRLAYVLPDGWRWVNEWIALSEEERQTARFKGHPSQKFRSACRRTFGTREKKGRFWGQTKIDRRRDCCFHDLRHSYAVTLAQKGASLTLLAQCLGDLARVAEKYYSGHMIQEEGLDTLESLFIKSKEA